MAAHFERGKLLYEQSRYDQAVGEFQAHLAAEPEDEYAHALMAMCLSELKRFDDALQHARTAIAIDPEDAFSHYALSYVEFDRGRYDAAVAAIDEAIRCYPDAPNFHAHLATIRIGQRRWALALESAERGLQCDPENLTCINLRALAQRQLGDNVAAAETMRDALARDPNDSLAHANQGWALLEEARSDEALVHFREALRLSPNLEYARLGIIEALKGRNFFYRHILRATLWLGKQSQMTQWGVVLGLLMALRFVDSLIRPLPGGAVLSALLTVVVVLSGAAMFFARPFFNGLLLLHPLGRLAMTRDQICQGLFALLLAVVYVGMFLASQFSTRLGWKDDAFMALAFLAIPALSIHDCRPGWPRWTAIGLMLLAPWLAFLPMLLRYAWPELAPLLPVRGTFNTIYLIALVVGLFVLCQTLEDVEVVH